MVETVLRVSNSLSIQWAVEYNFCNLSIQHRAVAEIKRLFSVSFIGDGRVPVPLMNTRKQQLMVFINMEVRSLVSNAFINTTFHRIVNHRSLVRNRSPMVQIHSVVRSLDRFYNGLRNKIYNKAILQTSHYNRPKGKRNYVMAL